MAPDRTALASEPARKRQAVEVVRDCNAPSATDPRHHWVFDYFPARLYRVPPLHQGDYIGSITASRFVEGWAAPPAETVQPASYPAVESEYFEWTDLLEAVFDATSTFTMIELGAGFGRWTVRGALAAKRLGLATNMAALEPDPFHLAWLREHMRTNAVACTVFDGAAATHVGRSLFVIGAPQQGGPAAWYGQCLVALPESLCLPRPTRRFYGDRRIWKFGRRRHAIWTRTVPLPELLHDMDLVDLIDMDVQGAEGEIIPRFADVLTRTVRRLHVETHSAKVERAIRSALMDDGWLCLRSHPAGSSAETPFGPISFPGGGIQSWINPTLY